MARLRAQASASLVVLMSGLRLAETTAAKLLMIWADARDQSSRITNVFPMCAVWLYVQREKVRFGPLARMAEPVDAGDSKSPDCKIVRVRVSLWACDVMARGVYDQDERLIPAAAPNPKRVRAAAIRAVRLQLLFRAGLPARL